MTMRRNNSRSAKPLPLALFLMGPTAAGKTELAVELVDRFPLEIISVDSALVYRGMDIGTAKPGPEILSRAPHRLIDICDPIDVYSVAQFRIDALREMNRITAEGIVPLLVGGTMLYFRALQYGLAKLPSADRKLRAQFESEAEQYGWAHLHERLKQKDPEAGSRIHPNDPQRIQRALEVIELTGRPLSRQLASSREQRPPFRIEKLVYAPFDRPVLRDRIRRRFHEMVENGLEDEVRGLVARWDLGPELPSMRTVGYRQMLRYIRREYSREQMLEKAVIATNQLAKRQFTWLRAEHGGFWLAKDGGSGLDEAVSFVERQLTY